MKIKCIHTVIIFLFILIEQSSVLNAQSTQFTAPPEKAGKFAIGGDFGMNYNYFFQQMYWDPFLSASPVWAFGRGYGYSPAVNLFLDYEYSDIFTFEFGAGIDRKYFANSYSGHCDCDELGVIYQIPQTVNYLISGTYLKFSLSLRADIWKGFFLSPGFFFELPTGNFTQDRTISIPQYSACFLANGTKTDELKTNLKVNIRPGFELGFGYKLQLFDNFYILPQVKIQYSFIHFINKEFWTDSTRNHSIGVSDISITNRNLISGQATIGISYDIR